MSDPLPPASEGLPPCPLCGAAPSTSRHNASLFTCRDEECQLAAPMFTAAEWRRLSAPRALPKTVVAVLRAAEVMTESGYHPEYFDDQDDAVEAWQLAGRPGLEEK